MPTPPASVEQSVQSSCDDHDAEAYKDDRHVGNDTSESGTRTTYEYTNIQELGQLHQLLAVIHRHIDEHDAEYDPDLEEHRELGIPPGDFLRTRTELSDALSALSRGITAGLPEGAHDHDTNGNDSPGLGQVTVDEFTENACEEPA